MGFVCGCLTSVLAQPPQNTLHPIYGKRNPATKFNQPVFLPLDWTWSKASWTAPDAPYLNIRREIDTALTKKRLTPSLLVKHEQLARQNPKNALAQFRWGYTLLSAPKAGIKLKSSSFDLYQPITEALQVAEDHSYQYARLRFLLLYGRFPYVELKDVGKRLLRRNQRDYSVKYYLTRLLSSSPKTEERALALRYAQELIRDNPKRASAYGALATVYEDRLFQLGDIKAADKGVASAKKYLSLISPKDLNYAKQRKGALWIIKALPLEKARQQREGFKPPRTAPR